MSKETNNLKLFKYDTATDGNSTFNIDTALNENWEKVDADSKAKADAIAGVKNQVDNFTVPVTKVNGKTGDVDLKAADINTSSGVSIESQLADITNKQIMLKRKMRMGGIY